MSAVSNTRPLLRPATLPAPPPVPVAAPAVQPHPLVPARIVPGSGRTRPLTAPAAAEIRRVQTQCLQLCLGAFFREQPGIRSMGFTSALGGEGKTLLALLTSSALATHTGHRVVLVDANWDRPRLHTHFGLPATPGLAEWLRGESRLEAICHQVDEHLTIVPAGMGQRDAIALVNTWRAAGLLATLGADESLVMVDLPPLATSTYGRLAARLPEALLLVVRASSTPDQVVVEACQELEPLRVEGVVLNQVRSHIPRWLRRML